MVRLPAEYQEVEYLENNGSQYIMTDIESGQVSRVDINFFYVTARNWANLLGTSDTTANPRGNGVLLTHSNELKLSVYGSVNAIHVPVLSVGEMYSLIAVFKSGNQELIVNGNSLGTATAIWTQSIPHMSIFSLYYGSQNNKPSERALVRVYSCKFYGNDDSVIANFIPCYRKSDNEPGMYDTVSGTFYTNSGSGTFLVGNDVSWDTASLFERRRQILLNTPHIKTVSDSMASFNTDISANLKECKVYFSPVQEGTGDPSPDNVRPISGWDGVTVTRCGKNLFDKDNVTSLNAWLNKTAIVSSANDRVIYIPCFPNTTYTISKNIGGTLSAIYTNEPLRSGMNGQEYVRDVANGKTVTITTSADAKYLAVWCYDKTKPANADIDPQDIYDVLQIEKGSTATPYEPYQGISIDIPFSKTIYGGYVDLVRGEVVETQTKVVLDGVNVKFNRGIYTNNNFYGAGWVYANPSGQSYYQNYDRSLYLCDRLIMGVTGNETDPHYGYPNSGSLYYIVRVLAKADYPDELTTTQIQNLSNEWLTENPLTFVYPLTTPNIYTLTPETIKTLKGINNIWSNGNGNIEVSYYSH